ncbi:ParA family protein [Vibrio sp. MA40-2]|uniref:ParA family protein n=1 Tax=Vibrio sp. MA40-2 TaxID=3391828 RepID=UPI0039A5388C
MLRRKISIVHAKSKNILILNLKGGVGKSTLAVNLTSKLCLARQRVELIDSDKQGSSYSWAKNIEQISAQHINFNFRSYSHIASSVKVDKDAQYIIIDSPANMDDSQIKKYLMVADFVLIPLQPSPVDLHTSLPFIEKVIANLATISNKKVQIGFVINRCTEHNPQVEKITKLLSLFKQYQTLGLMSDSYLYQEPFQNTALNEITLDTELWTNVFNWLGLNSSKSTIMQFPSILSRYLQYNQ